MARIVVVEGDARARSAIVKILRSRGHDAVAVVDAHKAIEAMKSRVPALLVADFATLGDKRNESIARLRATAPKVPTIFCAASRAELLEASSSAAASEGAGMVLGLKKPLRRQALLDTIARALAIHAAAAGGAAKPRRVAKREAPAPTNEPRSPRRKAD